MTTDQVRAARALLRWDQAALAEAAGVSLGTIKRIEARPGEVSGNPLTVKAIRQALEAGGIDLIPENGGGAGVRLRKSEADR